jgi:hypothetical protein
MNRFIGSSPNATTLSYHTFRIAVTITQNNYNTLHITVTHTIKSSTLQLLNCLERCFMTDCKQSQSYVTTDGQSASLSCNKAPIWGLRPDLYYCLTVACLLMWDALSDERTGLSFARVTVSSSKSDVNTYYLHITCY